MHEASAFDSLGYGQSVSRGIRILICFFFRLILPKIASLWTWICVRLWCGVNRFNKIIARIPSLSVEADEATKLRLKRNSSIRLTNRWCAGASLCSEQMRKMINLLRFNRIPEFTELGRPFLNKMRYHSLATGAFSPSSTHFMQPHTVSMHFKLFLAWNSLVFFCCPGVFLYHRNCLP